MPDFCDLPGCTNIASHRCSKCKIAYYCSKDHQRAGWKEHKIMCKEMEATKAEDKFLPSRTANEFVGEMDPMLKMMESMNLGNKYVIPPYHEEYKKSYPTDKDGYKVLRNNYTSQKSLFMHEAITKPCLLQQFGNIQQILLKRWGCFSVHLLGVICRLKVGEVWKDHPKLNNPQVYGLDLANYQRYQTMRNTASPKMVYERGKSYVSIGFVDLQQVMEAEILDSVIDAPVAWYGYEMSEIAVARVKIILDLIDHDAAVPDILQIWYSSCVSDEASIALQESCKRLGNTEKDEKLKKLYDYWASVSIGVKEAQARWSQHISSSQMADITRLRNKEDRVYYARYLFTGQFLLKSSLTNQGNVTWFCLPSCQYSNYKKESENIFHSFSVSTVEYTCNLKSTIEKRFLGLLCKMIQNIKDNRIAISIKTQLLDKEKLEVFQEIKGLQPFMIDWSNLPEYLPLCDFFHMAKLCSVPDTTHAFHLMNWVMVMFGCNLVDYIDVQENFLNIFHNWNHDFADRGGKLRKLMEELEDEFTSMARAKKIPNFFQLNLDTLHPMDISGAVLAGRFLDAFMEFMFNGQDLKDKKWEKRPYALIERSYTVADASFSFNS